MIYLNILAKYNCNYLDIRSLGLGVMRKVPMTWNLAVKYLHLSTFSVTALSILTNTSSFITLATHLPNIRPTLRSSPFCHPSLKPSQCLQSYPTIFLYYYQTPHSTIINKFSDMQSYINSSDYSLTASLKRISIENFFLTAYTIYCMDRDMRGGV